MEQPEKQPVLLPFFELTVPYLVRVLKLTPLLLKLTPDLPPILAEGLVSLSPFFVSLSFGFL